MLKFKLFSDYYTSPRVLNKLDFPQPFGPHTRTFMPDLTSNERSAIKTSPFGVTNGTCSYLYKIKRVYLSWYFKYPKIILKIFSKNLILQKNYKPNSYYSIK